MNPFISLSDFIKFPPDSYNLLLCISRSETPNEYIPKSLVYYIEEESTEFINKAKCIELDEDKGIIVYDQGSLQTACKAYWGFRATGHDDVRVLLGGLCACEDYGLELETGVPPQITQTEAYLPFNNAVIISYQDFVKKESYYQQILCAEKASFNILDARGNILSNNQLLKNLETAEIDFQMNKAAIVHGKYAAIIAALLKYLGQRSVSVVLDNTEGFVSTKKGNRNSRVITTEETDPGNMHRARTLPAEQLKKVETSVNQPVEDQSRKLCSCIII